MSVQLSGTDTAWVGSLTDPERFGSLEVVRAATSDELTAAHEAATEVWMRCGGHKLAARMDNVRALTRQELHDRDLPCPECVVAP
jgi:hypothetical protein